ncbi:hypothetical protein HDU78_005243 [Chytriomyces hyalinus]|nr:hypothetical protein HDU78_005243 [Chytriomyces hyalinus]
MASTLNAAMMQLAATGGLDSKVTENPETSLYTYTYEKVTPSTQVTSQLIFNERVDFGKRLTCTIPCLGDLLAGLTLSIQLPALSTPTGSTYIGWTNSIGYAMIETVQFLIGDTVVDEHSGRGMEIMSYLETGANQSASRDSGVGRYDSPLLLPGNGHVVKTIYIPLRFWFTKRLSSALPMIGLQQPVRVHVKLRSFQEVVTYDGDTAPSNNSTLKDASLIADYRLLGNLEEKEEFRVGRHEYLIEQWQEVEFGVPAGVVMNKYELTSAFAFCVKELVFVLVTSESVQNNDYFNCSIRDSLSTGDSLFTHASLYLDSKVRTERMPESYFRTIVPQNFETFAGNRNTM